MQWLIGSFDVFGVSVQNWIPIVFTPILVYIAVLLWTGRRRGKPQKTPGSSR